MLLFKYLSPRGASHVLRQADRVSLKFALPRTYNDPYELFLQTDRPLETEAERAFYDFWIATVIQTPVTCFSLRPDSVVMWAHYGREGTGACIAIDEDELANQFEVAFFENVEYSDRPAQIDAGMINYALTTAKRRHTLAAISTAAKAAYFMKRSDWRYESERRMVIHAQEARRTGKSYFCEVKPACVRFLIVGARASKSTIERCADRASQWNVPLLRMRIGRRSYEPFFTLENGAYSWSGQAFAPCLQICSKCHEPTEELGHEGLCAWCGISADVRHAAPMRSALAASLHFGIDKGIPLAFSGVSPKGKWRKRELESGGAPPTPKATLPF